MFDLNLQTAAAAAAFAAAAADGARLTSAPHSVTQYHKGKVHHLRVCAQRERWCLRVRRALQVQQIVV